MENVEFGKRLEESIIKAGHVKKDGTANAHGFAKKYGLTAESVRKWMAGREPALRELAVLIRATKVNPLWLIGGEGPAVAQRPEHYEQPPIRADQMAKREG